MVFSAVLSDNANEAHLCFVACLQFQAHNMNGIYNNNQTFKYMSLAGLAGRYCSWLEGMFRAVS